MLRSQSINASVDEIHESSRDMGFIKINIIGASSSGKTVLSDVLAHQLHNRDSSFEVHHLKDSDLINFIDTIRSLSKNNQILIFDDLSGLEARFGLTKLKTLEAEITTIRHIDDMEDRKIIMILNFHAQKKLSKFLRISNFTFWTDCQNEEVGYLEEYLKGSKNTILKFRDLRASSRMFHKFSFHLGKKNTFHYKDGKPFRVILYNNGLTTRFVVSPQLEWILDEERCPVCLPAKKERQQTKLNLEQFVKDYSTKFSKGVAKRAVELKLLQMGRVTQPKRVAQAGKYINAYLKNREIDLDALAESFGLGDRITQLHPARQPEYVEEVNPLKSRDVT